MCCDTYVALGNSTEDGSVIFGKNSDRIMSEAQLITFAPRKKYSNGKLLKCTHLTIPQVSETAAVILSQPYWMWGAEMGANEYNVVIGNEAVATKEPLDEEGLLGMDILRLGLERGKTAKESLNIIIELLDLYGQGGVHNLTGLNYHNSFLIADPKEAYILEAAGKWWIVEKVKDYRSISNDISIRGKGDIRKVGIIEHAIARGYCKDSDSFDFAMTFASSRKMPSYMECSMNQLEEKKTELTAAHFMEFLRDHEGNICRHKRKDFTAGSQVSHLREGKKSIHWFTGSSLACLSIFKPYIFPANSFKILKAEPYSEIKPKWFWKNQIDYIKPLIKGSNKENPDREIFIEQLRYIERNMIIRVDEIISNEDKLAQIEFLSQIESLNFLAWNKSEALLDKKKNPQ